MPRCRAVQPTQGKRSKSTDVPDPGTVGPGSPVSVGPKFLDKASGAIPLRRQGFGRTHFARLLPVVDRRLRHISADRNADRTYTLDADSGHTFLRPVSARSTQRANS